MLGIKSTTYGGGPPGTPYKGIDTTAIVFAFVAQYAPVSGGTARPQLTQSLCGLQPSDVEKPTRLRQTYALVTAWYIELFVNAHAAHKQRGSLRQLAVGRTAQHDAAAPQPPK